MNADEMGADIKALFREQVRAGLERQYIGDYPNRRKRTAGEVAAELAAYDALAAGAMPADVARRVIDQHLLRDAAQTVQTRFAGQPLVAAQLLDTIGAVFVALGLPDQATEPLESALTLRDKANDRSASAAATHDSLGRLYSARNELEAAERHQREAFRLYESLGPAQRENAAGSLINLGHCLTLRTDFGPAASVLDDALARTRVLHGPNHGSVAVCLLYLGKLHHARRTPAEGEPALREALDIFRVSPDTKPNQLTQTLSALGLCLIEQGRASEAEPLLTEALQRSREQLGDEHVDTLAVLNDLGWALMEQGKLPRAEECLRQSLDLLRSLHGDEHPGVPVILLNLSAVLEQSGRLDEAEPLAREAVDLARTNLGPDHPDTLRALNGLATHFFRKGDFASAETLQREVLALRRKRFGERSTEAAIMLVNLAGSLAMQKRWSEAEPVVREALAIYDTSALSGIQPAATARNTLVRILIALARDESASPQQRAAWLEEAEPLALSAARSVESAAANITFVHSVLQSCVVLYEARQALAPDQGHEETAQFWREKLGAWQATTRPAQGAGD
jgi:tetratricopeptide (TPR) repeat protein